MNPLWDYFWPILAAGVVIGAVTGHLAFRQMRVGRRDRLAGKPEPLRDWRNKRSIYFGGGAAASLLAAAVWSGPLGGADRLVGRIESSARATLDHLEMNTVDARVERRPMRRRLVLSGAADEFQRAQLVQILDDIRGVAGVRWATPPKTTGGLQ